MAQITKTVNKTHVNGSETFIYTFNASYSGLTEPILHGTLTDFFPSKINFILPEIGSLIKSITQTPMTGGTLVTFDFGDIPTGTSLSFTIGCQFGPGRVNNDSFTNIANLLSDGVQVATYTSETVHLTLDEDFRLSKSHLGGLLVRPGDEITFTVSIFNFGDSGAEITNVNFSDILPPQLEPITSFLPVGTDVSDINYSDPTYNGREGSWSGNTWNFNLPSFKGSRYKITFKARVKANVTPSEKITNTATWTVSNVVRDPATDTLIVFGPEYIFLLTKMATRTGKVGTPINYSINNTNRDIVDLNNYVLEDTLPDEVDITELRFYSNPTSLPSYSIFISLSSNTNNYIPVLTNVSGNTNVIDLTPHIIPGTNIKKVKITAAIFTPINSLHILELFGVINSKAQIIIDDPHANKVLINSVTAKADGVESSTSAGTDLSGASNLIIDKFIIPSESAYAPLDEFEYLLSSGPLNTITINPIFADLLSEDVFYVPNSEYFIYNDDIHGITYDSRNPGFPISLPIKEVIANYAGTGRTLLRWKFNNFILNLGTKLQVRFKCFVKIDSGDTFTNNSYLGNPGNNVLFVYNAIKDINDFDGDGIVDEYIASSSITNLVLRSSEFIIKKLVQGDKDLAFSNSGNVTPGGNIDYKFYITNNQKVNLKNLELVDILPWIGDSGVILTDTPRGSQFDVYATSFVTAEIINVLGDPVDTNPEITIEYSKSTDPIRFDQLGNPIGSGTWSTSPPDDITTLKSVKITTGPNVILKPYEKLVVHIKAKAPVNTPINKIAYNSFAVKGDQVLQDGSTKVLLPTEPNKVQVKTISNAKASIGQFVWEDFNGNGIYDENELGINGVTVQLYNESKVLLSTTVTANNANNQPGYYIFNNLDAGNYYVKFIPVSPFHLTKQVANQVNGSKPDPTTGFTNIIPLDINQHRTDINAGVLTQICKPPTINANNQCIHVGDSFDPLSNVTATDCSGNNITSSILVVSNTVNNQVPGVYTVIYRVADSKGQTTTKTILVKVCLPIPYDQSVTDLIQSVALEQAALKSILDAEGSKIQKSIELGLSHNDLICINNSVKSMIKAVTNLELILHGKLELFSCIICDECCDGLCNKSSDSL